MLKTAFDEVNAGATAFKRESRVGLLELASRFGSRRVPTPAILKDMFLQIATYEFILKPAAAIMAINSGIPNQHLPFWKALGQAPRTPCFLCKDVVREGSVHSNHPDLMLKNSTLTLAISAMMWSEKV